MKYLSFLIGVLVAITGFFTYQYLTDNNVDNLTGINVGSDMTGSTWFLNASQQIQAGLSTWGLKIPSLSSSGDCLVTNATGVVSTSSCGGGGGTPGGSNTQVQFNNSGSFAGDSGFTYSSSTDTLSVVSINATNSTTTRLAVTGTGTSTFAGGINTGANHIVTHGVQSDASDGLHIHASNGTEVGLFGAGNTSNALFYGALNIDGNTRLATSLNGVLTATAGAITASGTPYVTSIVATGTTATSTFAGAVGIGTTTPLSILTVQGTANVTSNFQVNGGTLFVDATNNRVGIGTTTPTNQLSIVTTANRTPWMSFFDAQGTRSVDVYSGTSSASSTGFGYDALKSVTSGSALTAFGSSALQSVTTATNNVGIGTLALRSATSGSNNVGVGFEALQGLTSGTANTAVGSTALRSVTSGTRNIGLGMQALYTLTTGTNNIGIGAYSGKYLADGVTNNVGATSSIYIGHYINSGSAGSENEIVLGNFLTGNGTNTITIGSSTASTLFAGKMGIGTTTPQAMLSVMGTSSSVVAQFTTSAGVKLLEMLSTGSTTAKGAWDFSNATVKQHTYKSFSFPTFATTTSATTTIDMGTAYTAESWSGADCYTTSGSGAFIFTDGTNRMNGATATTTVSRTTLSTNNTFTAQEKRYVEVGALTNAKLVCTVDIIVNN